jgi:hypothetical protein
MPMAMTANEFNAYIQKAEKHLEAPDLTMLILKGHLLVEEALYQVIRSHLKYPEYFEKAGLSLYQMVLLARSLLDKSTDPKRAKVDEILWDAMLALNKIRNQFAHQLEPEDISGFLKRLQVKNWNVKDPLRDKVVHDQVAITLSFLVGWLTSRVTLSGDNELVI